MAVIDQTEKIIILSLKQLRVTSGGGGALCFRYSDVIIDSSHKVRKHKYLQWKLYTSEYHRYRLPPKLLFQASQT